MSRTAAFFLIAVVYAGAYLACGRLGFEIRMDEKLVWPTALYFSDRLIPTLNQLRDYGALQTPLTFVLFGELEHVFHRGVIAARLLNFTCSFALTCFVGLGGCDRRRSLAAAAGLLLNPYFWLVSLHAYTDMPMIVLVLAGAVAYRRGSNALGAVAFILAIAARQYALAFPLGILGYEVYLMKRSGFRLTGSWLAPLAASASIFGWDLFFGGLCPAAAIADQPYVVSRGGPPQGLYFLSVIGLYFVIVESALFKRFPWKEAGRPALILATALAVAFVAFPPKGNIYFLVPTMGLLDRAARLVFGDGARIAFFWFLAALACLRLAKTDLMGFLLAANALLLTGTCLAWDKYALPLLAVLWQAESSR